LQEKGLGDKFRFPENISYKQFGIMLIVQLFDGFIFDIDGTLTSTNQLIFDSFNFIAKKYLNKSFTDEEIISMFGPTEDVILKKMVRRQI